MDVFIPGGAPSFGAGHWPSYFLAGQTANDGPERVFAKGEGFSQRGVSGRGGSSPTSLLEGFFLELEPSWHFRPGRYLLIKP